MFIDAFVLLYLTDSSGYRHPCENQPHNLNQAPKLDESHGAKDYDNELNVRNNRLHFNHKQKEKQKPKAYREYDPARYIGSTPCNDRQNFLNKIKQWFKDDRQFEPVNLSSWPGKNGHAVVIPEHLKAESEKRFKENQFNIVASDLMALNRSIPDQRSES